MKSKEALCYLDDIAHGRKMDLDAHELKVIVQKDLELLEIIKNKFCVQIIESFKTVNLYGYDDLLTTDDLDKIKEWLND